MLQDADAITTALQNAQVASHHIPAILAAAKKLQVDTPDLIERFVQRAEVRQDGICIALTLASLLPAEQAGTIVASHTIVAPTITHDIPMQIKRRGVEMRLVVNGDCNPARIDHALITTVARAHY